MKIRRLKQHDAVRTAHVIFKSLNKLNSHDYPKHVIRGLARRYAAGPLWESNDDFEIYVAVGGGRVVGTASLQDAGIYSMFVDPDFTRRGVGRALMNRLESLAYDHGQHLITLTSSITAVSFYLACGYTITQKFESLRTGCLFEMQKALPRPIYNV